MQPRNHFPSGEKKAAEQEKGGEEEKRETAKFYGGKFLAKKNLGEVVSGAC